MWTHLMPAFNDVAYFGTKLVGFGLAVVRTDFDDYLMFYQSRVLKPYGLPSATELQTRHVNLPFPTDWDENFTRAMLQQGYNKSDYLNAVFLKWDEYKEYYYRMTQSGRIAVITHQGTWPNIIFLIGLNPERRREFRSK